jgi:membrane protease YdiL (CAAX protease family)
MFLPAIAVLVLDRTMNEKALIRSEIPLRYVPVALFLIPVVLHAAILPTMRAGGLQWQEWLTPQSDGLYHTPASRGWGVLALQGLVVRIALNAVVGLAVVSILAFFEEVGWRAWLLPRLRVRVGARRAVVLTAIVWAAWHVPFQLSGIQHVDGVSPVELAMGAPLAIATAGLVIGWLWLRTESVWLCALAHGAFNNWGQYAFKFMNDAPAASADVALRTGFLALLVVGSLLLVLLPASKAMDRPWLAQR